MNILFKRQIYFRDSLRTQCGIRYKRGWDRESVPNLAVVQGSVKNCFGGSIQDRG